MSTSIHNMHKRPRSSASWPDWARHLPEESSLGSPSHGRVVTDHRSSWVRQLETPIGAAYVKTYRYGGWAHHLRSLGRRTAPWSEGRATREFDALCWLREHGFGGPEPLLVVEQRRFGFLREATLVTVAAPGIDAAALLPTLDATTLQSAVAAITQFVQRLHAAGFRDGNLDLRNLLLRRTQQGFDVAKIDSPRYRIRPPGRRDDRWVRADWRRLQPQLADAVATRAKQQHA